MAAKKAAKAVKDAVVPDSGKKKDKAAEKAKPKKEVEVEEPFVNTTASGDKKGSSLLASLAVCYVACPESLTLYDSQLNYDS